MEAQTILTIGRQYGMLIILDIRMGLVGMSILNLGELLRVPEVDRLIRISRGLGHILPGVMFLSMDILVG